MLTDDKLAFGKVMMALSVVFKGELTKDAIDLWWEAFQDWEMADFRAAASLLSKKNTYMPRPKDFEDLRNAGKMHAGEGWEIAVAYARSSHYRTKPSCGNAQVDHVVRMLGGYDQIGMCMSDQLHWMEKRFAEHWEAQADKDTTRAELKSLGLGKLLSMDRKLLK